MLTHNTGIYGLAGELIAFAICSRKFKNWTLSSEMIGYDNVNYGIWYDDAQAKKIALQQMKAAKDLGVRRIIIGECGHAHKAAAVVADRMAYGEDKIPVAATAVMDLVRVL